jgi:hypothetical protein
MPSRCKCGTWPINFNDGVAVHVRSLRGELIPEKGEIPVFEDKDSFKLEIDSGEIPSVRTP